MSKYWGYICQSHNPPIISDHLINHGEKVLADLYRKERAGQWPNIPKDHPYFLYEGDPMPFEIGDGEAIPASDDPGRAAAPWRSPIVWLREHPHCVVALHNQDGETVSLDPAPEPLVFPPGGAVMAHTLPFRTAEMHPIAAIRSLLAFDSRDWSKDRADAWLWGIVFGYEPDPDDPEDIDGGMASVAAQHGWDDEAVARLRILHERFKATLPPGE